ncbi:MAG: serine/threonine protein kinase [Thermogemmatispora sp.]|uniref:serine/threonine-protein kinase n=1 Tax=Thermogemmatispora sp. TaxID=1968838 RepID=UPI00262D6C77|nr:serine/threonine-protein kinase [Thermogemmatispora sp.]MBX5459284.1 serine/threonine protein kinase [Thermogemmatispora sp.]
MGHSKEPEERQEPGRQLLSNYELIRRLGRGGSSTVYLARHRFLSRWSLVALKRLQTPLDTAEGQAQFKAEVHLLEGLSHPHILSLLDAGIDQEDCPYLVTQYAAGGSLRQRLRQAGGRPLPLAEAVAILTQVGAALQYAHERGIIHRDLKPENILFAADGSALLADFGIALQLTSRSLEATSLSGTPAYMAPEQFRGQAGRESDQYALACVAYELCTGRRVFEEQDPLALMYCHTQREPEPLRHYNPLLPPAMEAAILRGLAKERHERYPSVSAFVTALAAGAKDSQPWGAIWGEEREVRADRLSQPPPHRLPVSEELATPVVSVPRPALTASWRRFPQLRRLQIQRAQRGERGRDNQTKAVITPQPQRPEKVASLAALAPAPAPSRKTARMGARQVAPAARPRERKGHWRWLALPVALVLLLLAGSLVMAYSDPAALGPLGEILPIGAPLATVHLTPASVFLTRQYLITGVTGTPSTARREVQVRRLSATVNSPAKTVPATGHGMTAGTQAHGTMTFSHGSGNWETVQAGSTFLVDVRGTTLSVSLDQAVNLPPADPTHPTSQIVKATVLQPGAIGNLPAGIIKEWFTPTMYVTSGPFTGGQDPQPYTYVQRSDLDNAANPLKAGLQQQAQQQLLQQAHSGERLTGPDCSTSIRSDHQIGDHATSVTLSVSATCNGAAYTPQAAFDLGAALLRQEAARSPGTGYSLDGQISTTIVDASLSPTPNQSTTAIITVKAQGRWTYQFNEEARQRLSQLIAGKPKSEALQLLQRQPGVSRASISIARTDPERLPTDPGQITIVVENST